MKNNFMKNYYFIVKSQFIHDLNLKGSDLLVFSVIFGMSQEKDMFCNMKIDTLADFVGYSEKQVKRSLERLKAIHYVEGINNNLYVNDNLRSLLNENKFSFRIWCLCIDRGELNIAHYWFYFTNFPFGQDVQLSDKMSTLAGQIGQEVKEK